MVNDLFARLFAYPDEDYRLHVERCRGAVPEQAEECAALLAEFAEEIETFSTAELEELYIQTFDWNPDRCLEIGWHLFGENYDRGAFLVQMRQKLRRYGLAESTELPDHLTHVLPVLGRMEAGEAAKFTGSFVLPALQKIRTALEGKNNPYQKAIAALDRALRAQAQVPVAAGAKAYE